MKIFVLVAIIISISTAAIAQGSSPWLSGKNYQAEVERRYKNRQYPYSVQAAIKSGNVYFRASFKKFPRGEFYFQTRHGLTGQEFIESNALYKSQGYKLISKQEISYKGRKVIQAVWIRQ